MAEGLVEVVMMYYVEKCETAGVDQAELRMRVLEEAAVAKEDVVC